MPEGGGRYAVEQPPIAVSGVDLIVTAFTASPSSPAAGDLVDFTVTIQNQGTAAVVAGRGAGQNIGCGIYLGTNLTTPITYTNFDGGLAAGASFTLTTSTGWAPGGKWSSTEGTFTMTAWVDDQSLIAESNDSNNQRTLSITVAAGPPPPPPGAQYFVATSPWNTPVPVGAVYTDAAALHGTGWIETHTYGVPVVHAVTSDPLTTISSDGNWKTGGWGWPETSVVVHCPSSMTGAAGTDGSIAIIEPSALNGYPALEEYDFWQFKRTGPNTATAASYAHTNTVTGTGWSLDGVKGAGIHAAGSALLAGLIVGDELRTGIHHTLAIAMRFDLVRPWPNFVAPAISADGSGGPMLEGQRVAIPPGVAMPGGMTTQEQTLWQACQTYGCYIIDVNGGNQSVQWWGDGLSVPDSDVSPGLINSTTFATPGMNNICTALRIVT